MKKEILNIPVVIFCGGKGTRLGEVTGGKLPKPLVKIGNDPILLHIMKHYAKFGYCRFILCVGYQSWLIKDYFCNKSLMTNDVRIYQNEVHILENSDHFDISRWEITLVETGLETLTAGRLRRVMNYVDSDTFMLTYGDGLSDVDLNVLHKFHQNHNKGITLTGVPAPGRFGEINTDATGCASGFNEKPRIEGRLINGGYMCLQTDYVKGLIPSNADQIMFEEEPMRDAVKLGEVMVYSHDGFWQCMDTPRDLEILQKKHEEGFF
ncbi:sugar phosphate nucleotidyltransferase [Alphaproteobacteria bacterium]|nr:sugar phosphate nucleotidyltransferase [Alphaproteobacteria bacterium]